MRAAGTNNPAIPERQRAPHSYHPRKAGLASKHASNSFLMAVFEWVRRTVRHGPRNRIAAWPPWSACRMPASGCFAARATIGRTRRRSPPKQAWPSAASIVLPGQEAAIPGRAGALQQLADLFHRYLFAGEQGSSRGQDRQRGKRQEDPNRQPPGRGAQEAHAPDLPLHVSPRSIAAHVHHDRDPLRLQGRTRNRAFRLRTADLRRFPAGTRSPRRRDSQHLAAEAALALSAQLTAAARNAPRRNPAKPVCSRAWRTLPELRTPDCGRSLPG